MGKKKSKPTEKAETVGKVTDRDRHTELMRKASGNTLHAQQADFFSHRLGTNNVPDEEFVVED